MAKRITEAADSHEVRETDATSWRWLIGIFALALAIRLLHLLCIRDEAFYTLLLGDGQRYDEWARGIASGNWIGDEVFYQAPLYPYFLAVVYKIFGVSLTAARVVQVLLGAASCVLLADAGRRFFSRRIGLIAGFALAVYAPAIFFDGLIQKSVLDLFFICLALWVLGRLHQEVAHIGGWLGLGAIMGGLILTRENALLFLPAVAIWMLIRFRPLGIIKLSLSGGALALGLVLVLLPVAIRNQVVGGEFHLTTSQFGPNFYIGNHEGANGTYQPLRAGRGSPRYERADAKLIAEQAEGTELSPAQISRFWTKRAIDYITSNPGDWIKLTWSKFALLWHSVELVDTESLESYADASFPLNLTRRVFHFGVLAPLTLLGVLLTWSRRREVWVLLLMALFYMAGLLVFYVVARYRYPMVPFLMLFAAAGLASFRPFLRRSSGGVIAAACVATLGFAIFSNWPGLVPGFTNLKNRMRGVMESNLGSELLRRGDVEQSIVHLQRAVEADGTSVEFLVNYGRALYYRGDTEQGKEHLDRALAINPDSPLALNQIGIYHDDQGNYAEAVDHYRRALVHDPINETIHLNLGNSLLDLGQPEEAIVEYREAIRLRPNAPEAHHYLGIALITTGRTEEGLQHVDTALQLNPDDLDAHFTMGNVLRNEQRFDEALGHLQRVIELEPEHFEAHHVMGFIYGTQGLHEKASQAFLQSLQIRPEYDEGHFNLGMAYNLMGQSRQALIHVKEAVRLRPGVPERMTYLAGMLAMHADESIRDPDEAIRIGEAAALVTERQDALVMDTLAAAYAAGGRFEEAIATAQEAIDLASAQGAGGYADDIRSRQNLYRQNQPYVNPPVEPTAPSGR